MFLFFLFFFYEGYVFVLAFVGPRTTNPVSQHLSCCPVTLESGASFGFFVVVVRFQLSQAAGLQTAKGDRNHFLEPSTQNLNKDIASLVWKLTRK